MCQGQLPPNIRGTEVAGTRWPAWVSAGQPSVGCPCSSLSSSQWLMREWLLMYMSALAAILSLSP